MKKIISLLVFLAFYQIGISQVSFNHTTGNVKDSIHNTGIDTLTYTLTQSYGLVTIQPIVSKTSGTAAGTSILSISENGTNYVNTDTLTLSNVTTNSILWNKGTAARYLRIITGGATTFDGTVKAYVSAH